MDFDTFSDPTVLGIGAVISIIMLLIIWKFSLDGILLSQKIIFSVVGVGAAFFVTAWKLGRD